MVCTVERWFLRRRLFLAVNVILICILITFHFHKSGTLLMIRSGWSVSQSPENDTSRFIMRGTDMVMALFVDHGKIPSFDKRLNGTIIISADTPTEYEDPSRTPEASVVSDFTVPQHTYLKNVYKFERGNPKTSQFAPQPELYRGLIGTIKFLPIATVRLVVKAGFPVCEWTNVCLKKGKRFANYIGRGFKEFRSDEALARTSRSPNVSGCLPTKSSWTKQVIDLEQNNSPEYALADEVVFLPGNTLIIDTHVMGAQYGHLGAKALQFFNMRNETFFDRTFMYTQSRYPSKRRPSTLPITQLVDFIMGPRFYENLTHTLSRHDLNRYGTICMERAYEVRNVDERLFGYTEKIPEWLNHADKLFDDSWTACPNPGAPIAFLQRFEGQGKRRILNMETEGFRVLKELGLICSEKDIWRPTISSNVSFADQARIFRNVSLMLSSHSSQLRNTIFSHPLSGTMELRAHGAEKNLTWSRYPSPFCADLFCVNHYAVSLEHDPRSAWGYRGDFNLNPQKFKSDLTKLLREMRASQEAIGCPLYRIFDRPPCETS